MGDAEEAKAVEVVRWCLSRPQRLDADNEGDVSEVAVASRKQAAHSRAVEIMRELRKYLIALLPDEVGPGETFPDADGSGILIRSSTTVFVLTAAHVWLDTLEPAKHIRIGNDIFSRNEIWPIICDANRDIATLRLPQGHNGLSIGAAEYPYCDIVRAERNCETFTLGFPRSEMNSTFPTGGSGLRLPPSILFSFPQTYDEVRQWYTSEAAAWTRLSLLEVSDDVETFPDLRGASGGPAFQECEGTYRLVGVHAGLGGNDENRRFVTSVLWDLLPDGRLSERPHDH